MAQQDVSGARKQKRKRSLPWPAARQKAAVEVAYETAGTLPDDGAADPVRVLVKPRASSGGDASAPPPSRVMSSTTATAQTDPSSNVSINIMNLSE